MMSRRLLENVVILVFFYTTTLSNAFEMAKTLRSLCSNNNDRALILPGVYDSLSAKIFADSGAEVIFLRLVEDINDDAHSATCRFPMRRKHHFSFHSSLMAQF